MATAKIVRKMMKKIRSRKTQNAANMPAPIINTFQEKSVECLFLTLKPTLAESVARSLTTNVPGS
jgi:hypothetical protein